MNLPLLLTLACLSSAPSAPDKFWLEADAKGAVEGSAPRLIEGVLLRQDETHYVVRVDGGEIELLKAQVVKIEKDALTVERIEREEKAGHKQRAAEQAAAEAAAQKAAADAAAEAAAHKSDDFGPADAMVPALDDITPAAEPVPPAPTYDPILHVVRPPRTAADAALLRDLEVAYKLTRDHDYIKVIRKLRRLR